jgi:hypothetical protein
MVHIKGITAYYRQAFQLSLQPSRMNILILYENYGTVKEEGNSKMHDDSVNISEHHNLK